MKWNGFCTAGVLVLAIAGLLGYQAWQAERRNPVAEDEQAMAAVIQRFAEKEQPVEIFHVIEQGDVRVAGCVDAQGALGYGVFEKDDDGRYRYVSNHFPERVWQMGSTALYSSAGPEKVAFYLSSDPKLTVITYHMLSEETGESLEGEVPVEGCPSMTMLPPVPENWSSWHRESHALDSEGNKLE
ncbi:MAG: hypothetical protein ACOX7F_05475 [Eubacteriales bacterium]|jgi:hypothetical protein